MRYRATYAIATAMVLALLAACGSPPIEPIAESNPGVPCIVDDDPYVLPGNPTCADLGLGELFETKIDPPVSGTYPLADGVNTVKIEVDGLYFDWWATIGIDAVIVKGGPNANIYVYDPEATSGEGLHSPINPNTDKPYGLSHITFCYDYEVKVTKTAKTFFDRTWSWNLEKLVKDDDGYAKKTYLTLPLGETFPMPYKVEVTTESSDSNWKVSGIIEVHNPAPIAAKIKSVTDHLDGIDVPVSCGVSFPYKLTAGATLKCSYEVALPDGKKRINKAVAKTSGKVGSGWGEAIVDFAKAKIKKIDECVFVSDDKYGELGKVCACDAPKTFNYVMDIGPYDVCGLYELVNTAKLVTKDTKTKLWSSAKVKIDVPCDPGCTLTPGYWKTHSEYGPAPYDETWAKLPNGADTPFFLSGQTYYEVLWTPPRGNAYYILAFAYIAAELNKLSGADFSAAQTAFDAATALFEVYTPADVAALPKNSSVRMELISLAEILDDYNNGVIGPGHCPE